MVKKIKGNKIQLGILCLMYNAFGISICRSHNSVHQCIRSIAVHCGRHCDQRFRVSLFKTSGSVHELYGQNDTERGALNLVSERGVPTKVHPSNLKCSHKGRPIYARPNNPCTLCITYKFPTKVPLSNLNDFQ